MAAHIGWSTWSEERREVWESVVEAAHSSNLPPDRAAACRYLLQHLTAWRRLPSESKMRAE